MRFSTSPQIAAARLKKASLPRPTPAILLGSGFHHALNCPLHGSIG
jgi:hypothetical protein